MNDTLTSTSDTIACTVLPVAEQPTREVEIIEIPGAGCVIGTPEPAAWLALCALVAEVEL